MAIVHNAHRFPSDVYQAMKFKADESSKTSVEVWSVNEEHAS